jgi:hypothetical protein
MMGYGSKPIAFELLLSVKMRLETRQVDLLDHALEADVRGQQRLEPPQLQERLQLLPQRPSHGPCEALVPGRQGVEMTGQEQAQLVPGADDGRAYRARRRASAGFGQLGLHQRCQ